ncbi:hypothetical protein ABZ557_27365 [Streptomyces sp. NPDC019645]|uniref:hypothetical protein n=1 Tax=Streptomyces sp. NPDC019645 TaxID=3154786 RepID=UPI0033EF1150
MTDAKTYPNIPSAMGSSFPVVTSLLAAISTSLVAVPLETETPGKHLHFAAWTSDKAAIVFGSAAVILFVCTTLEVVIAHAQTVEGMSTEAKMRAAGDVTDRELSAREEVWNRKAGKAYKWARFFWILGLCSLALTLGCVTVDRIWWLLPVMALLSSLIAAIDGMKDEELGGWRRTACTLVAAFSLYVAIAQLPCCHPYA